MAKNIFGDDIADSQPQYNEFGDLIVDEKPLALSPRAPKIDAKALYDAAIGGDYKALQLYNQRASSLGQPTIEQMTAENSPVSGQGFGQNLLQAYGRTGKQIVNNFTQSPEQVDRQRQLDAPLLQTGGGLTGTVLGQAALFAGPQEGATAALSFAPKAAPYIASAFAGGLQGGLEPVGTGESRGNNIATNAAFGVGGQAAADIIGAGFRYASPTMDKATADLIDKAYALGIRPNVGQVSKNTVFNKFYDTLGKMPFSGQAGRDAANQIAFNKAVGKTYGVEGEHITREAHAAARNRISKEFDQLTERNAIPINNDTVNALRQSATRAGKLGGGDATKQASVWVRDLLDRAQNGQISGVEYKAWREKIKDFAAVNDSKGLALRELRNSVDSMMDASVAPADRGAWQEARRMWGNMKTVEPLVARYGQSGDLPPAQLMSRATSNNAGKVMVANNRGGEIADAADIGQRFLRTPPDSGTPAGLLAMRVAAHPLTRNAAVAGGAYTAEQQGYISPGQVGLLALMLGANRGLLKAGAAKSVIGGQAQQAAARITQNTLPKLVAATGPMIYKDSEAEKKKKKKP